MDIRIVQHLSNIQAEFAVTNALVRKLENALSALTTIESLSQHTNAEIAGIARCQATELAETILRIKFPRGLRWFQEKNTLGSDFVSVWTTQKSGGVVHLGKFNLTWLPCWATYTRPY